MRRSLKDLLVSVTLCLFSSSCGVNVFEPIASKDSDHYWIEQARVHLDEQEYGEALTSLTKVEQDSNDLRLLRTAARLGDTGLSMWSILLGIVDSGAYNSDSGKTGTDQVFDQLSATVVGDGETKTARLAALTSAIGDLLTAPDPTATRVRNLSCFLAAVMAFPTTDDSTTAVTNTLSSLSTLAASTDLNNPNATCSDTSELENSLALMGSVQRRFTLILEASANCSFLDITGAASELNAVEAQLKKFKTQADRGCNPTPSCGSSAACKALGLNCVYQAITADGQTSTAQDGQVTTCELVQNCLDPRVCFGS